MEANKKIRLLIAEGNIDTRTLLGRVLSFEDDIEIVGQAVNGQEALDLVKIHRPDVMIADMGLPILDGITLTAHVQDLGIAVIIVTVRGDDAEIMRSAMRAGARDVLTKPCEPRELATAIRRAAATKKVRDQQMLPALAAEEEQRGPSRVIAFFSAKGGVGKTTIAVNMGALLAKRLIPTVLVDTDIAFGGVKLHLGVESGRSIVDFLSLEPPWSIDDIAESIVHHQECGLDAILSPGMPEYTEEFHPEHFEHLIMALKKRYRIILIDMPTIVSNVLLAILCLADDIVMVTTPDIVSLRNLCYLTRLFVDPNRLGVAKNSVRFVLNQGTPPMITSMDPQSLEEELKLSFAGVLPRENGVPTSIAKGIVLSLWSPTCPWTDSIRRLAEQLLKEPTTVQLILQQKRQLLHTRINSLYCIFRNKRIHRGFVKYGDAQYL